MTASTSMSGVGARGDLCTATIVWFIMITHMLYSASDPEPWQSTVSYIMESNHSRLVPLKCLPKRRNLNSAKVFANFPCRFLVHRNRGIKQSKLSEPHVSRKHTYDGVLVGAPKALFALLLSPPVSCSRRHDTSHLGYGGTDPCSPS
jgi:hypothetical protein